MAKENSPVIISMILIMNLIHSMGFYHRLSYMQICTEDS
jgi:hypothetical protein